MELGKNLRLSPRQEKLLDMHSVLNLLNIIIGELHLIQMDLAQPEVLDPPIQKALSIKETLHEHREDDFTPAVMQDFQDSIRAAMQLAESVQPELEENEEYQSYKQNMEEIFAVFNVRLDELLTRWKMPDHWEAYTTDSLKSDFAKFLAAVEKNAKGRYRILYNIAEQTHNDYLVHLDITSTREDEVVLLPLLFKDVMRDLIANARKYTPPGGEITIGLSQQPKQLRLVIEDSGIGIPKGEIDKVIDFGYRASNVQNKRSMGGGFGLTKALYVAQKFGGQMAIDSKEGQGTRIEITLPLPEEMWDD